MTTINDTVNPILRKKIQKRFRRNQRHIGALHHQMANCLMAEVALDILEIAPTAKTLKVDHLTEEYNEYNIVTADALLDETGKDLFEADEDGSLQELVDDILANYSADYLILLPETINLYGQLNVLSD